MIANYFNKKLKNKWNEEVAQISVPKTELEFLRNILEYSEYVPNEYN